MTAWTRTHCVCVEVRNLDYDEAAAALKIKRRWLEDNISRLPHQKYGKNEAVFCHCDLRVIQSMYAVLPPEAEAVINPPADEAAAQIPDTNTPSVLTLAAIKPAQGRRRAAARV
ncbi:hypothetical protein [Streptomyces carpinensis]|uniref:DNA-binding protein n=1 Tax=Streptomyces carpinensis TaxID=66369 RepID=A0ABV1VVQ0_9ACTN|nr:hypothetical protein [Streptomyces carpinensis]